MAVLNVEGHGALTVPDEVKSWPKERVDALVAEAVAGKSQGKGVFNYIDDAVRSVASGITFGYADELAAKMNELTGLGGSYEQNIAKERARDAQIPGAVSIPGEIAGAVGTTLLAAPIAAATRVGQAASALPRALKFGGLGAVEGAVAGSGNAVEGERLPGAGIGAGVGAGAGAAAPYVVQGLAKTAGAVKNAFSPQANVAADLARAIARDADNPAAIMARANDLSIDRPGAVTLADVGGENVRGLVERVANTPGAGRTQVIPALTARQQGQASRIATDLKELTGTSRSAVKAVEETMAERATAAKPLYKEAMSFDAASSPEVTSAFLEAVSTGWGQAIIKSGKFRRTLQTEYGIKGQPGNEVLMPVIDAWKKQADDMVGDAVRAGRNNEARVIGQMRDRVIEAVDAANPAYAKARQAWAGPTQYLDGIERGRGILNVKESAEEFAARWAKLSDVDKEAERIGSVSSIIAKMGSDGAKLGDMTKYLRSPEVRAKIAAIMPTEEAAQTWARRLDSEVLSSELTGRALGNSATARRLAERQDAESLVGDLVLDALTGSPQSMIKRVLGAGPKWLKDTMRSRADALLAETLTNPAAMNNLHEVLRRTTRISPRPSDRVNAAATAAGVELLGQ